VAVLRMEFRQGDRVRVDLGQREFHFPQRLHHLKYVALRSLRIKGSSRAFPP